MLLLLNNISFGSDMGENEVPSSSVEIGRHLMRVRDRADLKQGELAKRVSLNPAVLSCIESGERTITSAEALDILAQIETPEARELAIALQRIWTVLPRPPLDHPDQDTLWDAEQVASELVVLRNKPDTPHAFESRLSEYIEELKRCAGLLLKREHQVAFIGSIGVGKSTAICRMTGLEFLKEDGTLAPVLEVGGGGITVCEVHLRTGPDYGLLIEPRTDDEIRQDVGDLVDHILKGSMQDEDGLSESQGISKEVARALRNMAGLAVQRLKGIDGKRTVKDPAKDLAELYPSQRELVVEVLSRMELHRRDRRDVWYDSASGKSPKVWLRDTFSAINNGRHPDVTLPKRIEVVIPERLLNASDLTVRFIDTKGIDRTAAREDIELHLDDTHTLAVLCSPFNNAPSAEARLLLERARDAGVRDLEVNVALLVLPRPNEAMAMKDDATSTHVESAEEGYDLKEEQARMALEPMGLQNLAIGFYNANEDPAEQACNFLVDRLNGARSAFRERARRAIHGARGVLKNHGEERVRAVLRDASETLYTWIRANAVVPSVNAHIQESLMSQIQTAYAATVRASVRREGEWPQLSYSHHIGYGARRLAVLALEKAVEQFSGHCKLLSATPRYAEATELISQAERVLVESYKELLRKTQLMGQTVFRDALKADPVFWQSCFDEWGQGPGYKRRVAEHNRDWFDAESHRKLQDELKALIKKEWGRTLQSVTELLEPAI
ncbi:helix-turn-helix domain-containing protein [Janthinobacterium lividum]|uniref:Helix-turn-helix transcriptional regulator n=1 Tax=Janthinobacterium lividum TaxID=29581 RepID=A0ABU0XWP6_9BURK|nr:helix-turn-helix transcriptional regulator [Janthinobacterium lividum]MDQ4627982.1 helix-turn-helix transcriptional regulator [Janthinobacterium lividum]MDQ4676800.1 helix-turn-helix transcriptional regulator [Janthinobacterium lividum]MDQ4686728.1 helix-turn-helix transcriptional regulator [Janthinobacterium lividum]